MSLRPTTELLDFSYDGWDDWPRRPTEVSCPACNREGKWSESQPSYLEIPCYECVKCAGFVWGGIPCNGAIKTPQEELDRETPTFSFRGEYTNHEMIMKVIDDIYQYGKDQGTFMPSDSTFNTMDNVMQSLWDYHYEYFECRPDIGDYVHAIWNHWESLGNWPNVQEGDHEHEIRFFKQTFQNVLPEYEDLTIMGVEEELSGVHRVILGGYSIEDEIIQPTTEDQSKRRKACHDGIDILEKVMESNERMKEEDYRQLMNIFKTIHDN